MNIDRIVLYIISGSDQRAFATIKNEIEGNIVECCGERSKHAVKCVEFGAVDKFRKNVRNALFDVSDALRVAMGGFNVKAARCVFLINSTRDAKEWGDCIAEVRNTMKAEDIRTQYTAIVQKDDMDMAELAEVLAPHDFATYLFTQWTEGGYLRGAREEIQLMASYAMLAGCGILDNNIGVYTGSFDRLSLREDDFDRIRYHLVAKKLTTEPRPDEDVLFMAFFGKWAAKNGSVTQDSDIDAVESALEQKLTGVFAFPEDEALVLLAKKDDPSRTEENIREFIKLNFAVSNETDTIFTRLLARFVNADDRESPVAKWGREFENVLTANPVYYSREVAMYLKTTLANKIRIWAQAAEGIYTNRNEDVKLENTHKDAIFTSAIKTARKCMEPYKYLAVAELLKAVLKLLERKSIEIRERVRARDEITKKWRISEDEMEVYKHYAKDVIGEISVACNNRIHTNSVLRAINFKADAEHLATDWDRLMESQVEEVRTNEAAGNLIDILNDRTKTDDAHFVEKVKEKLYNNGFRLKVPEEYINATAQISTCFIYTPLLNIQLGTEREFKPDVMGTPCRIESAVSRKMRNVLKFVWKPLELQNEPKQKEGQGPVEHAAACRRELISRIPNTYRYTRPVVETYYDDDDDMTNIIETKNNSHVAEQEGGNALTATMLPGNVLQISLPAVFGDTMSYEIRGFDENGTPRSFNDNKITNSQVIRIQPRGVFGKCEFEITYGKYYENGRLVEYTGNRIARFMGAKAQPEEYTKKRPVLQIGGPKVGGRTLVPYILKLADKNAIGLNACARLSGSDYVYPLGENSEWTVYIPKELADGLELVPNDVGGVRELMQKN